jgi:ligand-binding sensor domain-containing protein/serine phosphatase RsbU (regulator of sigma subunit)
MSREQGLPITHVTAFAQDKTGFMWIGTPEGLVRADGVRTKLYRPDEKNPRSISGVVIEALAAEDDGKVWVGTHDKGVNLYDPATDEFTRFVKSNTPGSLPSDGVSDILRDANGRVWFTLIDGGIARYEPTTKTFAVFRDAPLTLGFAAIAADAQGNLWLGAAEGGGVVRWSPETKTSTVFDIDKLDLADDETVTDVTVASNGRVWIATDKSGALVLDPATGKVVERYSADDTGAKAIQSNTVRHVFESSDKRIWIATSNGLSRLGPDGSFVRYDSTPGDPTTLAFPDVLAIYQDRGGVMWLGGFTVGVCRFDDYKLQFGLHRTRSGSYATSFEQDADGTLWVGSYNDGLYKYDRKSGKVTVYDRLEHAADGKPGFVDFLNADAMFALHRDKRGVLWIATRAHGLTGYDTQNDTYRDYPYANEDVAAAGLSNPVFDIWEDRSGVLWLGTWGSGLVAFDPATETAKPYRTSDNIGMSSDAMFTVQPDAHNPELLWLGTSGGGLVEFNLTKGTARAFRAKAGDPTALTGDDVQAIAPDVDGTLWLGTNQGLDHFDPGSGKVIEAFTTTNSQLTNNTIYGLLRDDSGMLWLGTNTGGLLRFDPKTKQFSVFNAADGAQDEFNQCAFMKTATGELAFGGPLGWNLFQPKDIKRDPYVPPIAITGMRIGNQEAKLGKPIWTLPKLELTYQDSFEIQFAALSFGSPQKNHYQYKLDGYDDKFIDTDRPYATFPKLPGGNYTLRVRASNRHGVWNEAGTAIKIYVAPPFWRTWPAFIVYLLLLVGTLFAIYRYQRERLRRAEREGRLAVVERDLALTGAVQTGFLPEQNELATQNLQLVGLYRPADACGGDWWWYEQLASGRHVIMVGDVTGHGPGPAMVTAAVATAFRVLLEAGVRDIQDVLEALNREVLRVGKGKYHMTMAALEVDEESGQWIFHSAGGPPLLLLNSKGKHRVVFCPGAPLGTEGAGFEIGRVEGKFKPTERMLLYTDGIPEIALPSGSALGMRRFASLYESTRQQHLREAANTLMFQAVQAQAGQPQADDWTFTIVEWGDGAPGTNTTMTGMTGTTGITNVT